MAPTYNELLEYLLATQRAHYPSIRKKDEALLDAIHGILQSLLEKLRDEHEPAKGEDE
jgi:prenyltransferase beta subunit